MSDPKRDILRHLVAAIAFRGNVAVREAPEDFADFKPYGSTRTPGEILAHIGDLLEGSTFLLKGEMHMLNSAPMPWRDQTVRFRNAVNELDSFLAGQQPINVSVERLVQGPIADALTHIGQIVFLRRAAGSAVRSEQYFQADIEPGKTPKIG